MNKSISQQPFYDMATKGIVIMIAAFVLMLLAIYTPEVVTNVDNIGLNYDLVP